MEYLLILWGKYETIYKSLQPDRQGMGRGVEDEGEVEEVSKVGRGRKKGRDGAKRKKTTDDDGTQKISKRKSTPKNQETSDVQADSTLHVSPGLSNDLIRDNKITKARSKEGKGKVKKVGLGGYLSQSTKHHLLGQGTMLAPTSPVKKQLCLLRG